jgi:hypothetical protein
VGQIILGVYITGYCLYAFTSWVRAAEISTERLAPNVIGIYVKGNIDRETSIWMTYDVSMIFLKTIKEPLRFSAATADICSPELRSAKGFGFDIFRHFCHQACAVRQSKESELLFGFHAIRHHWQIESPTESNHRANESAQRRFT